MKNKTIYITILIVLIILSICIIYTKNNNQKEKYEEQTPQEEKTITLENDKTFTLENNKNIEITNGGTYKITGTSTNSNITINTEDEITLILDNVDLTNQEGPALIIENAKKTTITLYNENKLSDGNNKNTDYDAVIYSKDDLIINGEGLLEINTTFENGIKSNDDLIIDSNIKINSNTNGIIGKDSITIKSGNIDITSNKDAIKSDNEEKGNIIIEDGNITINSKEDGIQGETLTINNGTFNIKTNNGAQELTPKQGFENNNTSSESTKALKATNIIINNGTFIIDSYEDGIHSNGNLTIENGTFTIKSSDDGLHADKQVEINDGTLDITASEGIEATSVKINGGNININASDDGINAGKKSDETPTIEINGGNITIKMQQGDTDGIDSNGNLYINGGTIDITCNSPFDYDGEGIYKGGKLIVNGKETNELTSQFGGMQGNMQNKNMTGMPNQGMRR